MFKKAFFINLVLIQVVLFLGISSSPAYATLPNPAWWVNGTGGFSQYDTYQFKNGRYINGVWKPGSGVDSALLGTGSDAIYDGVAAIGPLDKEIEVLFSPNSSVQYEWQCAELVKRLLYLSYGSVAIPAHGYQVVDNYSTAFSDQYKQIPNDGSQQVYPKPRDVVSYGSVGGDSGHTAVVKSVTNQSSGSATVELIEQNAAADGTTTQSFSNWQFNNGIQNSAGDSHTITGWLTNKWVDNSPTPGVTYDIINSVSASSSAHVWAAGIERTSPNKPVTYFNNGSGWIKYYPPNPGNISVLNGITASPSGEAWAVGSRVSSPSTITLAYRWNPSTNTWSTVTSESPSATQPNTLSSVAIDGGGTAWAVGNYWPTTNQDLPLIEKWNGTKFASVSAGLPSGVTAGELKGVSFSSATNGWAVGYAFISGTYTALMYQYDGSTWSPSTPVYGSLTWVLLNSVYTVSDTEAWAVGTQKIGAATVPVILHYTSANGWQEDTGFASLYPNYTGNLLSVNGDGASNIWIVNSPYLIHYDGTKWNKVYPKAYPGVSGRLKSVAVNSGNVWVGGLHGTEGSWTETPLVYRNF
jgi:hypothetical protein